MDEAEKLAQRLFVMAHGKIVVEGAPHKIIEDKVKKFALEIREAGLERLRKVEGIISQKRGSTHIYFAETLEALTPLMNLYGSRQMILRPASLEDVFLQLLD